MKRVFLLLIFLLSTSSAFSQQANISSCPFKFERNLQVGDSGKDVYVLQQILNSDKRTTIALDGVGAPGSESNYFGKGTREALKRFQALFIEYIGVADGKFNSRTLEVIQSLCEQRQNTIVAPETNTAQAEPVQVVPATPLLVSIIPLSTLVASGDEIRVEITSNKEMQNITPDVFIVDGGVVGSIRKLNKQKFLAILTPNEGARFVVVQVEAEKIFDTEGGFNQEASREVRIDITPDGIGSVEAPETNTSQNPLSYITNTLSNILQQSLSTKPATKVCNGVQILESAICNPGSVPANIGGISGGSPSGGGSSGGGGGASGSGGGGIPSMGGAGGGAGGAPQSPIDKLSQIMGGMTSGGKAGGGEGPEVEEGPAGKSTEPVGNIQIPANTPEACKKNYGFIIAGSCSTKDLTGKVTKSVAEAGMAACAANGGKPVTVTSVHRTYACNKAVGGSPASNHLNGAGIDVPPRVTLITRVLEAKGFKRYDEVNHWHYSMTGR